MAPKAKKKTKPKEKPATPPGGPPVPLARAILVLDYNFSGPTSELIQRIKSHNQEALLALDPNSATRKGFFSSFQVLEILLFRFSLSRRESDTLQKYHQINPSQVVREI